MENTKRVFQLVMKADAGKDTEVRDDNVAVVARDWKYAEVVSTFKFKAQMS